MGIRILLILLGIFCLIMGFRALILGHTPINGYWDAPMFTAAGIFVIVAAINIKSNIDNKKGDQPNNIVTRKPERLMRTTSQITQPEKIITVKKENTNKKSIPFIYHLIIFVAAICGILSFLRSCA